VRHTYPELVDELGNVYARPMIVVAASP
jgi:hypothetical protein